MLLLNVGGGGRTLPERYAGWDQHLLDIDPDCKPDFCMDAKGIARKSELAGQYDVVYCSHCLEHFYKHEVAGVLAGFMNALKLGGVVDITVPNVMSGLNEMRSRSLELDDVWYRVDGRPITFHDVIYGWGMAMSSGKLGYAHKCAFTGASLLEALIAAWFKDVKVVGDVFNLNATGVRPCQ